MNKGSEVQGYIFSRPIRGRNWLHRIQNLVIRDYAQRMGLHYRLSFAEYAPEGCYLMLDDVVSETAKSSQGIIFFSLFQLPESRPQRYHLYERVLANKAGLHFALENLAIRTQTEVRLVEEMIMINSVLPQTPFSGSYRRGERPSASEELYEGFGVSPDIW